MERNHHSFMKAEQDPRFAPAGKGYADADADNEKGIEPL
jgi:hypothetical protein